MNNITEARTELEPALIAEPVGYVSRDASIARMTTNLPEGSPLYTAPVTAQAQWVQHPDITDIPDDVLTDRGKKIRAAQQDADTESD